MSLVLELETFFRRLTHATGTMDATAPYITMFDDVTVSILPSGGSYAYGGYVDGNWPTYSAVKARFPKARILDIAVFSSGDAECLDIENGDATNADAPGWVKRQKARGVYRPCLYTSASNLKALEETMANAGFARSGYRLWAAHYGRAHICGPKNCGYGLSDADGTQWTLSALGRSLDESMLDPDFFEGAPPAPAPNPVSPTWMESMLNALPTLQQGDIDKPGHVYYVHLLQAIIEIKGKVIGLNDAAKVTPDGDFGPGTKAGLVECQKHFGLTQDGVCGPKTWAAIITE